MARKAVEDAGFAIPTEIYIREALYGDVMALQFEGDPQMLSEQDKEGIRSTFDGMANVEFFSDPSVIVGEAGNMLPDRLAVLIGPIENQSGDPLISVGVIAGSELSQTYIGRYPVDLDTGDVGESPPITIVP